MKIQRELLSWSVSGVHLELLFRADGDKVRLVALSIMDETEANYSCRSMCGLAAVFDAAECLAPDKRVDELLIDMVLDGTRLEVDGCVGGLFGLLLCCL